MSNKKPKIAISGYYGFDNSGDEAVLLAIVHCLKKLEPGVRIVVFSNNTGKTRETYGVGAAYRWNPFSVALSLLTCRLLISGGGSLIQDVTSSRSASYYMAVIRLALFFKKKVMIYSQGIGPLNGEKNRAKALKLFRRCDAITVRDRLSADFLKELGLERDVRVVSDPVMALGAGDVDFNDIKELLKAAGLPEYEEENRKPLLFASVRLWKENAHIKPVAQLLDSLIDRGCDVLLVPAHYPSDMGAIEALRGHMDKPPYVIDKCLTARQFLSLTAYADKVLSMRLHGLICAMAVGTPMVGLSYDPKVDGFMEQAGLERYCLPYDGFDLGFAMSLLEVMDALPPDFAREQNKRREEMRELAWAAAAIAIELLRK